MIFKSQQQYVAPTIQNFTTTGTGVGYVFTITTSSTVAVGDTYTNNGNTYTVLKALTAQTGQVLFCSNASLPQASGTLTRATGSGTASITFTLRTVISAYTTPSSPTTPLYLRVKLVGGGGGGGGSGTGSNGAGGDGTASIFGLGTIVANGGTGATVSAGYGSGGTTTVTSPATKILGITGATGQGGQYQVTASAGGYNSGGGGGVTPFGGAGGGGKYDTAGISAVNETGSGGGGAGGPNATGAYSGGGGGAGGYADAIISNPSGTYYYCVGTGGAGGTAGTAGYAGGAGADAKIVVEEYYQ